MEAFFSEGASQEQEDSEKDVNEGSIVEKTSVTNISRQFSSFVSVSSQVHFKRELFQSRLRLKKMRMDCHKPMKIIYIFNNRLHKA